jgi:DNA-binding transcriptional MerR regulator/methylmalonyl-CoA mutase cobalamin-binding subunit
MTGRGRYRINAVAEMTGIAAPTLRAWERRYGVPSPARTDSSYRLYSEQDVGIVMRMRDLTRQGVAAAEAARIVLGASTGEADTEPQEQPFEALQERILDALQRFDLERLEAAIQQATLGSSAYVSLERVFIPLLRRVGQLWERGQLSVGQEHLLSEMLTGYAREVLRLSQPPGGARSALLACFADEQHVLPLLVVAFHLAQWGYRTTVLGARTPPEEIRQAVEQLRPDVVCLSTICPSERERMEELVREYADACGDVPWVMGGAGTDGLERLIGDLGGIVAPPDLLSLQPRLSRALAARKAKPRA